MRRLLCNRLERRCNAAIRGPNDKYVVWPGSNNQHIHMAGRLSCDEADQIRPHVLYRPCVAITVYGGAVRGCLPGTV